MSRTQILAADGLHLGSITIPMWALWVLALIVVLLVVCWIVVRLARRARKIARATNNASQGTGESEGTHGFGFFGAVTSAITIIPDVKSRPDANSGPDAKSGPGAKSDRRGNNEAQPDD